MSESTTQRVLILGAGNFIGQRVLATLRSTGWAAPFVFAGKPEGPALAAALERADAVVNCTIGAPSAITATAEALFGIVATLPRPLRVVHLSSMTVYGKASGRVTEDRPLIGNLGRYSAAQVDADYLAARQRDVVILRPGYEYGPGCPHWGERVARWLLARRIGDLGESGTGTCNLIYIDDLAAAVVAALRLPGLVRHAFNLAGSQPTWNDYFAQFGAALGVSPLPPQSPARLWLETQLYAPVLKITELAAQAFGGIAAGLPPAIPPSLPGTCRRDVLLDVSNAETVLGLRWTPLAEGLQAAAAPFRSGA